MEWAKLPVTLNEASLRWSNHQEKCSKLSYSNMSRVVYCTEVRAISVINKTVGQTDRQVENIVQLFIKQWAVLSALTAPKPAVVRLALQTNSNKNMLPIIICAMSPSTKLKLACLHSPAAETLYPWAQALVRVLLLPTHTRPWMVVLSPPGP